MKKQYARRVLPFVLSLLLAVTGIAAPVFATDDPAPAEGTVPAEQTLDAVQPAEGQPAGVQPAKGTDEEASAVTEETAPADAPEAAAKEAPAAVPAGDPKDISGATVTGISARTYTGSPVKPVPTVVLGSKTLVKDTDYTVAYSNNTGPGTAKVTITGTGAYTGTITKSFIITRTAKSFKWAGVDMTFKDSVQQDNPLGATYGVKRVWQTSYAAKQKLTWNKPASTGIINGYIILRRTGTGAYKEIKRVGKTVTTYTDTTATKTNTWYSYVVVSYRKTGSTIRIAPSSHWVGGVSSNSSKVNAFKPKMDNATRTLDKGQEAVLAVQYPRNTYSTKTRWYTSNSAVVSVNSKGEIKGLKAGTATITARIPRGWDVTCKVTVTGKTYDQNKYQTEINKYGKTFILVDISDQKMVFIKNGKILVDTPVVTGMYGSKDTPKGTFSVFSKMRNTWLDGPTWHNYVSYWMEFKSGGWGIHDATWRDGKFGGTIYKGDGSHGCVNTPLGSMKVVYENAPNGTKVVVRQ